MEEVEGLEGKMFIHGWEGGYVEISSTNYSYLYNDLF